MISPDYVRTMARYNAWQNNSLYREADLLSEEQRHEDRGAFFKTLDATLSHILWADLMWMSRFDGWEKPGAGPVAGQAWMDWPRLKATRFATDARIADWAARLTEADLQGDLSWYSGIAKAEISRPRQLLVTHIFNHQTHHRGQAHALLTGFGMTPDPTDLAFMPDDA